MTLAGVTPVVVGHSWGDSGEAAADWLVANHVPERRVVPFQNAAPVFVKPLLRVAVIVLLLSLSRMAHADAVGDLEKGYSAYAARKFSEAETRLRALLAPGSELKDPDKVADARMYLGAVLVAEGRTEEASTVFETLLERSRTTIPTNCGYSSRRSTRLSTSRRGSSRARKDSARGSAEETGGTGKGRARAAEDSAPSGDAREAGQRRARGRTQFALARPRAVWGRAIPEWPRRLGVGFSVERDAAGRWKCRRGSRLHLRKRPGREFDAWILSQVATARAYRTSAYNAAIGGDVLAGGFFLTAIIGALQAELTFVPGIVHVRRRELPRLSLSLSGLGISGEF